MVSGTGDGHNTLIAASASPISSHVMPSLRRATAASSFSTRTFVSKNALSLISLVPAERKARRQRSTQTAKARERLFFAPVAPHLELALSGDSNFNLVSLLQIERFDHR